ncbi:hypothetical protein [Rhodanobacter sp. DHG33]|uniref:hypothetical protein n=1 Tax=Rhodanobacter sp. DHG33 TaxID=2775921 RepID=UPI00177AA6D7|nr:hypothetical protein [Rhodanobacter sp. DHG33]MBD8900368.1 hypothetical protein [Rhodanobacter sp. DHG33]
MKAEERRQQERILHAWQNILDMLNRIGPESDSQADLEGYGEVKDYVLDRIERVTECLTKAAQRTPSTRGRKPASLRPKMNSLHAGDNAVDNPVSAEVANG